LGSGCERVGPLRLAGHRSQKFALESICCGNRPAWEKSAWKMARKRAIRFSFAQASREEAFSQR
jgi:hypothetical protein